MLEARVKQLQNQARRDFSYNESLNARLVPFLKKEAVEKEDDDNDEEDQQAWPLGSSDDKKEAAEKEDDDDEEDQQAWPSGSSDDDGPVSPIRSPRGMRWLKCPICLNYLYEHKNGLLFHVKSFIKDAMSPSDVVQQYLHLSRLLDMQP
jgi:hypothetical protein